MPTVGDAQRYLTGNPGFEQNIYRGARRNIARRLYRTLKPAKINPELNLSFVAQKLVLKERRQLAALEREIADMTAAKELMRTGPSAAEGIV